MQVEDPAWVSSPAVSPFHTLKIFKRKLYGLTKYSRNVFYIRRNLSSNMTLHPTPSKFFEICGKQTKKLLMHNYYYTHIKMVLCLMCRYENLCDGIYKKKGSVRWCVTRNNFEQNSCKNLQKLFDHCMDLSRAESTWCLMFSRSCSIAVSSLQTKQKQTVQIVF